MLVTLASPPFADTAAAIQAIFIAIVLAGGYVLLWAIWHFFFRGR